MVKRILQFLGLAIVVAVIALWSTFWAAKLSVPDGVVEATVATSSVDGITIKAISSGHIKSSAAFAYRGGAFTEERLFITGSILIEHPKGNLLIDTGLGASAPEHLKTLNLLARKTQVLAPGVPVGTQLQDANYDLATIKGILLTHAHWDHVSGIQNLQNIPVLVPPQERQFIRIGGEPAALAKMLIKDKIETYDFKDGAYNGFEKSFDFYGDKSIVIVPAFGHTPGSVIIFVNTSDGKNYAFIGDLAWQKEGVEIPAERPWFVRKMIDHNGRKLRPLLVHMHRLKRGKPELIIVPAHDDRIWKTLPKL